VKLTLWYVGDPDPIRISPVQSVRVVGIVGLHGLVIETNTFGNEVVQHRHVAHLTIDSSSLAPVAFRADVDRRRSAKLHGRTA